MKNGHFYDGPDPGCLVPFYYERKPVRTIRDETGIWFVARDVCEALGLTDASMSVKGLDEDEKLIQTLFVSGQSRRILSISESGLYTLIIRSNKPQAKKFRKWITSEVLPSIRKTGFYGRVPEDFKVCRVCRYPRHIDEFSPDGGGAGRMRSECKDCRAAAAREKRRKRASAMMDMGLPVTTKARQIDYDLVAVCTRVPAGALKTLLPVMEFLAEKEGAI